MLSCRGLEGTRSHNARCTILFASEDSSFLAVSEVSVGTDPIVVGSSL